MLCLFNLLVRFYPKSLLCRKFGQIKQVKHSKIESVKNIENLTGVESTKDQSLNVGKSQAFSN